MKLLLVAAGALACANTAAAVTAYSIGVTDGEDPAYYSGEVAVVTFDAPNAVGVIETDSGDTGSVAVHQGPKIDFWLPPTGDLTNYEAIWPGGEANFDFSGYAPGVGDLSVYVGSVDTYNNFHVTTNLGTSYYVGADFMGHDGDPTSTETNRRLYFFFKPGEVLQSFTFGSTGIAFEYDTIAVSPYANAQSISPTIPDDAEVLTPSSTPEPAAWALMLVGVTVVGGSLRGVRTRHAKVKILGL